MIQNRLERIVLLLLVVLPLAGTGYAMVQLWERLVTWRDVAIMFGMFFVTSIGITIGYHRMLTHRSFAAHPVVRFLFLLFGSMAIQGPTRTTTHTARCAVSSTRTSAGSWAATVPTSRHTAHGC